MTVHASYENSTKFGIICVVLAVQLLASLNAEAPASAAQSVQALSPEEEAKTFVLPEGYRMELALSEKDGIKEPVNVTFDGDGRMYVAEWRSYMQDIHGNGRDAKNGRVSQHESTQRNGVFDKHTVFADNLRLPRMVLPLDDRVLINESNTLDLYSYRDSKHVGVADQKELVYSGGPVALNIEHQHSGLVWGMDNWCYITTEPKRFRFTAQRPKPEGNGVLNWVKCLFSRPTRGNCGIVVETTPENGGQWGLAQDNFGKLWWSNGGAEIALYHFQTPIIYGALDLPEMQPPDFPEVWPLVGLADVQGGPKRFRPENGTLNHFTAACGQEIFRGDQLPQDLRGDALVCEPVGRLVRRAKVEQKEGITTIRNAYEHSEFIRSTDPCFRPVNLTNGPDGCLYIVDMYRGIVQDAHWLPADSYLYPVVQKYGMDKMIGRGRIWRLVHKDFAARQPWPRMNEESAAQLAAHLEGPNGWRRDTAQKLLVLRHDLTVTPALKSLAVGSKTVFGRIHGLWTLEGLDALDSATVRAAFKDPDARVRIAAIRASESLCKNGDATLVQDIQALSQDPDSEVALQTLLTGKLLHWPNYQAFAEKTLASVHSKGVKDLGMMVLNDSPERCGAEFSTPEMAEFERGKSIYQEVCFACHGFDGKGMPMDGAAQGATLAPPLAGARDVLNSPEEIVRILLHGMNGPIGGTTYPAPMISMGENDDAWIAAVSTFIRNSFGNHGAALTGADVARLRSETKDRAMPWTPDELAAVMPPPLPHRQSWKASAIIHSETAQLAIDGNLQTHWSTIRPTQVGDWFQIELPEISSVAGARLTNSVNGDQFLRGCEVRVSLDGKTWSAPIAQSHGTVGITELWFSPVKAKFLRVIATMPHHSTPWTIDEAEVLAPSRLDKRLAF